MKTTYQDLEIKASKAKSTVKTYYLEQYKYSGELQIDKVTTDEEHKARSKAISLIKNNEEIEKIDIIEVARKEYCTTITR